MNHKIYDAGDIFDAGEQYVPTEAEENEGSSAIKTPAIRLGWNIRRMIHIWRPFKNDISASDRNDDPGAWSRERCEREE